MVLKETEIQGECHVTTEIKGENNMEEDEEVGVMYPYTKECQIFLINH